MWVGREVDEVGMGCWALDDLMGIMGSSIGSVGAGCLSGWVCVCGDCDQNQQAPNFCRCVSILSRLEELSTTLIFYHNVWKDGYCYSRILRGCCGPL